MLFYLEHSAQLLELSVELLADPISGLIQAHRSGTHLVVIDRQCASWLHENVDLSKRDKAMLERMAQEFTQSAGLRRKAKAYVRLTADRTQDLLVQDREINIALEKLTQYRLLEKSILLVENIETDGRLYEFLLHNHSDLHSVRHIALDRHHGGGDDLPKVFAKLATDRRIVCAAVDSDKNCPQSANPKIGKLLRLGAELNWPFALAISPPCREAENLIPMEIVMALPSGFRNATNQLMLDITKAEANNGDPVENQYWLHFDTKLGLRVEKLKEMSPAEQQWISGKLRFANCDPTLQAVDGYGDRVLFQLLAENRFMKDFRTATRHENWRRTFSAFLDEFIWLFLCGQKIVT
jgi:hypothetical protein